MTHSSLLLKSIVATMFMVLTLLSTDGSLAEEKAAAAKTENVKAQFPSAVECAGCHQQIYNEWASSNHAYASISPMFHKFEQKISDLTQGTIGTFCVRCHQQVGTQLGEKREMPLWERSAVSREGITCVTCHRISKEFGKVNGERSIDSGDIHAPVGGTMRDSVFDKVLERSDELKIATGPGERGTKIHAGVYKFEQLGKSEFCVSCHQVAVNLGIKLEVVWDQYRDSPAFKNGVTCQDCHMGKVPGVAAGYEKGPSAIVAGEPINPNRRHSNHAFYGPGYPIAHPGIFPHNPDNAQWSIQDWLKFDHRAGWGTEKFEELVADRAEAIDGVQGSLEALGGNFDAIAALKELETAAARGIPAFEAEKTVKVNKEALEAIEEVVDGSDVASVKGELEEAIEALSEVVEDLKIATVPAAKNRLVAAAATMLSQASGRIEKFEDAMSLTSETFDMAVKNPTSETITAFSKNLTQLRQSMPAADNAFQASLTELKVALGVNFPAVWSDPGDRESAREAVTANEGRLEEKKEWRQKVMENGSRIDGPFFQTAQKVGETLKFNYRITNLDDGHNLPSGSLGAQPEIWLNTALTDPDGKIIWESGYVDSIGDFADNHSLEVASGKVKFDKQLFNLQSKFLTTNIKGTDREMYLPVNIDVDQLPMLRSSGFPTTVLNHAPFVRMEGRSIPPLGHKDAEYYVPGDLIKKPGKYKLSVRMRSRAEPIYFMRFVEATTEMERSMNEWMIDIHPYTVEFEVGK